MTALDSVLRAVAASHTKRHAGAFVVALDGRSGAGKSTLAHELAPELAAAVVHGDDFYRDMPEAERRELSPAQGVTSYFDWQRLRDEALIPLRARTPAQFRCFDWTLGHGLGDQVVVEPRDIVIVEGVYSARPEFDELIDLKVLVTIDDARRMRRLDERAGGRDRQAPDAWDARWDAAECVYFETIRPAPDFDLVVRGDS